MSTFTYTTFNGKQFSVMTVFRTDMNDMNDILYISIYIDDREYSLLSLMNDECESYSMHDAKEIEQRLWFQNNSLQKIQFVKEKLTESELDFMTNFIMNKNNLQQDYTKSYLNLYRTLIV
jgi:hypothetical protein